MPIRPLAFCVAGARAQCAGPVPTYRIVSASNAGLPSYASILVHCLSQQRSGSRCREREDACPTPTARMHGMQSHVQPPSPSPLLPFLESRTRGLLHLLDSSGFKRACPLPHPLSLLNQLFLLSSGVFAAARSSIDDAMRVDCRAPVRGAAAHICNEVFTHHIECRSSALNAQCADPDPYQFTYHTEWRSTDSACPQNLTQSGANRPPFDWTIMCSGNREECVTACVWRRGGGVTRRAAGGAGADGRGRVGACGCGRASSSSRHRTCVAPTINNGFE